MTKICVLSFIIFQNILIAQPSNWTSLGPFKVPELNTINNQIGPEGIGRTSCIKFDPDFAYNNIIYVGSPGGGLWKLDPTTGLGWQLLNTDNLLNIGVADIAIDPTDAQIIYLSTGDPDAFLDQNAPGLASTAQQSRGMYKSIDGGQSWSSSPIGVWYDGDLGVGSAISGFWDFPSNKIMRRVNINSQYTNEIIALVKTYDYSLQKFVSYIYKSIDSGLNWYRKLTLPDELLFDLEVCPSNPEIIYVSGSTIYKSLDGGDTWYTLDTNGLHLKSEVSRTEIAVTGQDPTLIYALQVIWSTSLNEFYVSTDQGDLFSQKLSFNKSQPWRSGLAIDQTDFNKVLATG